MTVVPASNGEVATEAPVYDEFTRAVMDRVRLTGKYVGGAAFLASALGAATLEEATAIGEVIAARAPQNERIRFVDAAFMDSDPELESDIPIFAVATVVREMGDGTQEKMSCGASHVLGVLIAACEHDWFPFDAELVQVNLGGAKKPINLRLAPRKVEAETQF